ncbi:hypothetical protein SLS64_010216 [Diaporthe eres]
MPRDKASQLTAVARVKELTEVKYEEYCKRGWHTKKGDTTKETNIKIKARDIMCAALKFDSIVKAGLMFDPSVFDSVEVLARFLPKYAIIEDHYLDRKTQQRNRFEDQIKNVYISILKYAACVQRELNRSLPGKKTPQFEELKDQALEALDQINLSVKKLLEAEKLRTFKWLSGSPLTDKQQQLRSKVERLNKNSGKWLLASEEYLSWLASPHTFLWLHGTSGCGKSMLFSTVVKSLVESAMDNSNVIVSYWYFDNADSQTQNLQRLLRLVLRRISAKASPFPEAVRDLANKHEAAGSAPGTAALIRTLKDTVAMLEEDAFLVLDAIDEYQTGNEALREEFLDLLVELGNERLLKLHILVTSISESDIENAFVRIQPPPASMDVEKPVSVDVEAYLATTIERYGTEKQWGLEIKTRIETALKNDGRFRIVSLQLQDLRKCYDDKEIDAALENIPPSIEDAYVRKLQNVPPKDVRRLRHVFYWISVAARQLTTSELAAAPGVDLRNSEYLFDLCPRSMVRLGKQTTSDEDESGLPQQALSGSSATETNIATFDHPSVKRFLYSSKIQNCGDSRISPFFVSEKTVNAEFAKLMIDHLLAIQQPNINPSSLETMPFLPYAARYWHENMKNGGIILEEDEVLSSRLLILFGDPMSPAYLNWIRTWNPERETTDFGLTHQSCSSPLYMSVFLGLGVISNILVDKGSYINGTGGVMHTTLQLASQRDNTSMSQKLIVAGEKIDEVPDDQPTALYIAVDNGNVKLVELLLAAGARPNAKHPAHGSALQLASFGGLKSIVESLIASGADVNLRSGLFGTALQAAAAAGHSEIVAILLDKGAEPDAVGGILGTAIQAAESARTEKLKLAQDIQGQGKIRPESKHYVYRASFFAALLHLKVEVLSLSGKYALYDKFVIPLDQMMDSLSVSISHMAYFQKIIEHGTSDELLAARHELANCYALALELVYRGLETLARSKRRKLSAMFWAFKGDQRVDFQRYLDEIQRGSERVESLVRITRLQEPFNADTASKMQHELLEKTQQEVREVFRTHEEYVQKELASLEHRIVDSVRDMLPGIIREEMRKLLAEQRENTNT